MAALNVLAPTWSRLVQRDRVDGSVYTDPAIFRAELDKIWYRGWVYVGHESEIPRPNDFVMPRPSARSRC